MAKRQASGNLLESVYADRITEPSTDDEVYGYWLFALGLVASVVGVAFFLYTTTLTRPPAVAGGRYWATRQIAVVLAAGGVPLMLGGVALRLPLRAAATRLTYLGMFVCLAAIGWFVAVYPASGWPVDTGHTGVIGLYTAGLAIIGVAAVLVPMLSRAETETASERAAREDREREAAATDADLDDTRAARDDARAEADAAAAELAALRESQARFEIYEDAGSEWRWRLRHRNGNVIADGGEGYASRQKCQQGMHSVRRNALGAAVLRVEPEEADEAGEADEEDTAEPEPIEYESQAAFELFEDDAGEYRWRLVHDNGNVIADGGEGYASKSNAKRAMAGVREHAASADYLRIDPAGFELYRDRGGEWRWRLVHENGEVLADGGEGYASRQKARQGLDSVRSNAADAEVAER